MPEIPQAWIPDYEGEDLILREIWNALRWLVVAM